MPRGDGTGPGGMGPMTGRAAGYCAGYSVPGFANPIPGRGYGYGRGFGRGYGRGFGGGWGYRAGYGPAAYPAYPAAPAQVDPNNEAKMVEEDIKYLKQNLEALEDRLAELKEEKKK